VTRRPIRRITIHPAAKSEIESLPLDVRRAVVEILIRIRDYETSGKPLGDRASTGDLSDCFKYYFDPEPSIRPGRYRLVYRLVAHDRVEVVVVETVAVGLRNALEVYHAAARRLGRHR
jgi:mRNA-degrading endonuclease RelE of RelBE toxin-antitoxin system